ncbi:tRNA (guanine-N(7))-methyltransferase, partial [Trifolium medium]|nr:tRNA (guanine-N(7))-methyltransferase [Trifolium medium]
TPAQVPDWNQVFADPALPLMVDIGCGVLSNSIHGGAIA